VRDVGPAFEQGGQQPRGRGMIELAWGHLLHQKGSPLTRRFWKRASGTRGGTRKTMIVALARKLLIVLWRLATTGETPAGLRLRPAA
jgi:transposase